MPSAFFEIFTELWVWPALALAFFMGIKLTLWWERKTNSNSPNKVNQQYFQGLNFLLNEQPDKAIEVFIQALEVDSETVELHLALGGLFRRKGEVDRATRIHQNLIARPSLTEDQRSHAICELAHDYYKAGLFDRAENLYLELKNNTLYRVAAIEGLCSIYQKEKEWKKAIEIMRLYKRAERNKFSHRVSHYWCELAQQAIDNGKTEEAKKHLRAAVNENRSSVRAIFLRGQVCFREDEYQQAIDLWQSLAIKNKAFTELVIADMIVCYKKVNNINGLRDYLGDFTAIPKDIDAFNIWLSALNDIFGEEQAIEKIANHVQTESLSGPVSGYLLTLIDEHKLLIKQEKSLLKDLLNQAKINNFEYTCNECGFDTKAMHWHCPNCGEWDSFS